MSEADKIIKNLKNSGKKVEEFYVSNKTSDKNVVNVEEEIAKCEKELERLTKEIQRCEGMLNNQNFISKAPQAKINAEKDKLTNYREQYDLTQATLVKLKG